MWLQRGLYCIQAVNGVQKISQTAIGCDLCDPERDDGYPGREGFCDFPTHMLGLVCILGENQNEHPTVVNALDDSFSPIGSIGDIPGSDPAFDLFGLKPLTNRIRRRFVFTGMADK